MSDYERHMGEVTIYLDPESIRDHCGARGISLDGLTDEQIKQAGLMAADTFESDARVWEAYHDAVVQSLAGVRPARERLTFRLASEIEGTVTDPTDVPVPKAVTLTLELSLDGAAFHAPAVDPAAETDEILTDEVVGALMGTARKIAAGETEGHIIDTNGNTCGSWSIGTGPTGRRRSR